VNHIIWKTGRRYERTTSNTARVTTCFFLFHRRREKLRQERIAKEKHRAKNRARWLAKRQAAGIDVNFDMVPDHLK